VPALIKVYTRSQRVQTGPAGRRHAGPATKIRRRMRNAVLCASSLQIHRPIRVIDKCLPALVLRVVELNGQKRAALGLGRWADEFEMGFLRGAAAFAHVAGHAGADDVFPGRVAAAAARDDVVETELAGGEMLAAILAAIAVAGEQIAAVEADRLPRDAIERQQANHARHLQLEIHAANPVVVLLLEGGTQGANFAPRLEVVIGVLTFLEVND